MSSSPEQRLQSWREVVRSGKPAWLAALAPGIVAELEAEIERPHTEHHRRMG